MGCSNIRCANIQFIYIYIYIIYCILKRKEGGREGARVPLRDGMVDIEVTVPEVESVQYY